MSFKLTSISDSLLSLVVPRISAAAGPPPPGLECWVVREWCDGAGCWAWWQRRHRYYACTDGTTWTTHGTCAYEC